MEGDAELILRAQSIFDRLESKIDEDSKGPRTNDDVIVKALSLFDVVNSRYCNKIECTKDAVSDADVNVANVTEKLNKNWMKEWIKLVVVSLEVDAKGKIQHRLLM